MTTKPKARKFRIRTQPTAQDGAPQEASQSPAQPEPQARPAPSAADVAKRRAAALAALKAEQRAGGAANTPRETAPEPARPTSGPMPVDDGEPYIPDTTETRMGEVSSRAEVAGETDIDAIRQEGLTGRQLRMARRVAQKYGLAPTSDFDAVRQLRERGIDPFKPTNMLELVVPGTGRRADLDEDEPKLPARTGERLPKTVPLDEATLPSTEVNPTLRRQKEIMDIQRDIARRRRRRLFLLFTRLAFFVFAPTILAGYYFYVVATPMYSTKSQFLILQADNAGGSGLGGLLQGTQFATNQDAIAVQSYLQSKDAMVRLDSDVGFKAHFSQDWIDPIQRLENEPTNEQAYSVYQKYVKISYDPTEGVIKMEVSAADPEVAANFSRHLIDYAEERVDELSRRKREDSMQSARESLERAKVERREAQEALVRLQEQNFVDPEGFIASLRQQISNYEVQLQEKQLQLQALLDNARPNQSRVEGTRGDIRRLSALLADLNAKMTEATSGEASLAETAARIQMAQADLVTADLFLQSALTNEKQTELEASRQVRYLTTSVNPVAAQDPSYPRSFENTVLAFLIFAGIYLMLSLTASILREQVST
ncbi:capsule biosynthesis protein [Pseudooceanicola sp. C21-150M6]|uniref:capsule biosynthesis protein n=1 Tax=Pseudooceanicola sp. C21-150M6 TaxID=3434355 RepID=UPI003D7F4FC4